MTIVLMGPYATGDSLRVCSIICCRQSWNRCKTIWRTVLQKIRFRSQSYLRKQLHHGVWPRSRKPIQVTLWMGNRGALTDVKNAHPSEFWIRIGFGWGRMEILPAVTMSGHGACRPLIGGSLPDWALRGISMPVQVRHVAVARGSSIA